MNILNVVGTRPNFIKMASIMEAMSRNGRIRPTLLHTGQHYDDNMNRVFFDQLGIPRPDLNLNVAESTNPAQVGEVMKRFDELLSRNRPDAVLVVGDVSSTLACALTASYHRIPVVHVEAGLRSFDRDMPEEINRILTDQVSDFLFITEPAARANLYREGIDPGRIHFVGNVMVDTLLKNRSVAEQNSRILADLRLKDGNYAVVTLHRPSNVDTEETLRAILGALGQLADELPVVFPIHPRTRQKVDRFGLESMLSPLVLLPPQSYLDMLQLMGRARMVLTDSGGMQEETTILEVPCLTLRENTERPITIEKGTNMLVGADPTRILESARNILVSGGKKGTRPELWDGKAAGRVVDVLCGTEILDGSR
ncbi:MAG: UDP-N-acetylglucosamine 2-epimerase (non-hydrolyzing), partial [Nitrospinae bacterium CG11_big_fil_rev_8_21_14_0_20_56_8]